MSLDIIFSLEVLLSRLSPTHPSFQSLSDDLQKRLAGQLGEEKADTVMEAFSSKTFHTIRDLRFNAFQEMIQIDQLHVTTYFALFLETKHIRGNLFIDENFGQLTRSLNDVTVSYSGVIQQMERQEKGLSVMFQELQIPLPIFKMSVLTHPIVHLHTREEHLYVKEVVCRIEHLAARVRKLIKKSNHRYLTDEKCLVAVQNLAQLHIPPPPQWYNISKHEILKGVQCTSYQKFGMIRTFKNWKCPYCSYTEVHAHRKAFATSFK